MSPSNKERKKGERRIKGLKQQQLPKREKRYRKGSRALSCMRVLQWFLSSLENKGYVCVLY